MSGSSTCRSCGAAIKWFKTVNGRTIPIDAEPSVDGNVKLNKDGTCIVLRRDAPPGDEPRHTSHFATCPQAAQHRKAR